MVGFVPNVILVDDEPSLCRLNARLLRLVGMDPEPFVSPLKALARLAAAPTDLLVTDVRMLEMSGTDLARAAQRDYPWLPVLLTSGYPEPRVADVLRSHAFLPKPYDLDQFVGAVRQLLGVGASL